MYIYIYLIYCFDFVDSATVHLPRSINELARLHRSAATTARVHRCSRASSCALREFFFFFFFERELFLRIPPSRASASIGSALASALVFALREL